MKNAFTLLEMLLVITVIAVMAALVFVYIKPGENLEASNEQTALAHINQIADALEAFTLDGYNIEDYAPNIFEYPAHQSFFGQACHGHTTHVCAGDGEGDDDEACVYDDEVPPMNTPEDWDESEDLGFLVTMGYLSEIPDYPFLDNGWGKNTGYMISKNHEGVYKLCVHESIIMDGPIVRFLYI